MCDVPEPEFRDDQLHSLGLKTASLQVGEVFPELLQDSKRRDEVACGPSSPSEIARPRDDHAGQGPG